MRRRVGRLLRQVADRIDPPRPNLWWQNPYVEATSAAAGRIRWEPAAPGEPGYWLKP